MLVLSIQGYLTGHDLYTVKFLCDNALMFSDSDIFNNLDAHTMLIRLREMMDAYEARTGEHLTYGELAARTELSRSTIESMATRPSYNASLDAIERICVALHCQPGELLRLDTDQGGGNERR